MARPRLADEAWSRSMNGMVERIYRNGVVVAEKHRYDNRLTMAVLARLDSRIDRAEEMGAPHLALIPRWDEYLAALGEDRREDGLALLAPPEFEPAGAAADLRTNASDHELHELHLEGEEEMAEDRHLVWGQEDGRWTDYPPPEDFDGEEEGEYGRRKYRRTLSPAEQAVVDSDLAMEREEGRALGEAQRDAYFGFGPDCEVEDDESEG